MSICYYLTHPNVDIDPAVPVPEWELSDIGRSRIHQGLKQPWLIDVDHVVTSVEKKAIETGQIIASHLGVDMVIREGLHENDRSATGYLPKDEFEKVADEFFARPAVSIRGWERALDAQTRVVAAIKAALADVPEGDTVLFTGHGGVGTLLKCHLANAAISREHDGNDGGGSWFAFERADLETCGRPMEQMQWQAIEPEASLATS